MTAQRTYLNSKSEAENISLHEKNHQPGNGFKVLEYQLKSMPAFESRAK